MSELDLKIKNHIQNLYSNKKIKEKKTDIAEYSYRAAYMVQQAKITQLKEDKKKLIKALEYIEKEMLNSSNLHLGKTAERVLSEVKE